MIKKSELKRIANRVYQDVDSDNVEVYHSQLAQELKKVNADYKTNPPEGWNEYKFGNLRKSESILEAGAGENTGPVYSFQINEELYIEVVAKETLSKKDTEKLKKSVNLSKDLLYFSDSISRGVIINFPKKGAEPEFYWHPE